VDNTGRTSLIFRAHRPESQRSKESTRVTVEGSILSSNRQPLRHCIFAIGEVMATVRPNLQPCASLTARSIPRIDRRVRKQREAKARNFLVQKIDPSREREFRALTMASSYRHMNDHTTTTRPKFRSSESSDDSARRSVRLAIKTDVPSLTMAWVEINRAFTSVPNPPWTGSTGKRNTDVQQAYGRTHLIVAGFANTRRNVLVIGSAGQTNFYRKAHENLTFLAFIIGATYSARATARP